MRKKKPKIKAESLIQGPLKNVGLDGNGMKQLLTFIDFYQTIKDKRTVNTLLRELINSPT